MQERNNLLNAWATPKQMQKKKMQNGYCPSGHKVEKHHSEEKNVRRTPHTKRKRKWYKKILGKILGKTDISKKKETRVAIGLLYNIVAPARRAAVYDLFLKPCTHVQSATVIL